MDRWKIAALVAAPLCAASPALAQTGADHVALRQIIDAGVPRAFRGSIERTERGVQRTAFSSGCETYVRRASPFYERVGTTGDTWRMTNHTHYDMAFRWGFVERVQPNGLQLLVFSRNPNDPANPALHGEVIDVANLQDLDRLTTLINRLSAACKPGRVATPNRPIDDGPASLFDVRKTSTGSSCRFAWRPNLKLVQVSGRPLDTRAMNFSLARGALSPGGRNASLLITLAPSGFSLGFTPASSARWQGISFGDIVLRIPVRMQAGAVLTASFSTVGERIPVVAKPSVDDPSWAVAILPSYTAEKLLVGFDTDHPIRVPLFEGEMPEMRQLASFYFDEFAFDATPTGLKRTNWSCGYTGM